MRKFFLIVTLVSLFSAISLTQGIAQVRSVDQLAGLVVNEFRIAAPGQSRVVVRDFRVPGSIEMNITDAVKSKLKEQGYEISLVADYEIEGRIKTTTDYQGFQNHILKLTIINPSGYDRTEQFTIAPDLANMSGGDGQVKPNNVVEPSNGKNRVDGGTGIKIPETKVKDGRHQIYPDEEWKLYGLKRTIMRHARKGFVTNRGDWQTFWALSKSEIALPNVDFDKQIVRVEAVAYPRTINAEIFSASNGNIDVTKDISTDPPTNRDLINVHVLIINKSDIAEKRKVRLGVTVDATIDNRGVIITSVVDGAPITQGKLDDGRKVALEPGDVIYSLDGISTNSVGAFAKLIKDSNGLLRAEVKNVQNGDVIYVTFELN